MSRDTRPRVSLREVEGEASQRSWVIVADGSDAGVVTASLISDRVEIRIFVEPRQRRLGVARQALGRVIGMRPFDAELLSATTSASDAAGIGLLRATGFAAVGETDGGGHLWVRSTAARAQTGPERFLTPDGRIQWFPAASADLRKLLDLIVPRLLSPDEVLTESEMNERAARVTDEVALLRRQLVDHGLVERTPSGSEYALVQTVDNP